LSARHETLAGGPFHYVDHRRAVLGTRRDIEEHQFIRALAIVFLRALNRIARVAQVQELRPLHHTSAIHVETRYDAFRQHEAETILQVSPGIQNEGCEYNARPTSP
jgi:hypothetical protein